MKKLKPGYKTIYFVFTDVMRGGDRWYGHRKGVGVGLSVEFGVSQLFSRQ